MTKPQLIRGAVREEVKAETEPIKKRLNGLEKGQQEQGKKIDTLLSGQSHIETAMKTLATKQDVERVEKEVEKIKKRLRPVHAD